MGGRGTAGPVSVAWADAAVTPLPDPRLLDRLGAAQARRHARAGARGDRFLLGRMLLAELITEMSGQGDIRITSRCARCGADHGPPRTDAPVALSVAYAGSMVAAAAAPGGAVASVGVDLERAGVGDAERPMPELTALFAPARPPTLAEWTQLEAVLKADGRGLRVDPGTVRFGGEAGATVLPVARRMWLPGSSARFEAATIEGPAGYVLSVAVACAETGEQAR